MNKKAIAANDGLAAAGALTCPVCPVSQKTHVFGRFPHFWSVPEKSDRRTSPLSDLNDRPQGLLWPETGHYSQWADSSSCNKYSTALVDEQISL